MREEEIDSLQRMSQKCVLQEVSGATRRYLDLQSDLTGPGLSSAGTVGGIREG